MPRKAAASRKGKKKTAPSAAAADAEAEPMQVDTAPAAAVGPALDVKGSEPAAGPVAPAAAAADDGAETYTAVQIEEMPRRELQRLCKQLMIKANGAVRTLTHAHAHAHTPPSPALLTAAVLRSVACCRTLR
jgi:hypothetical protein